MQTNERNLLYLLNPIFFSKVIKLIRFLESARINYSITSGFRNFEKQRELYLTNPSGTTDRPGTSYHEKGRALDIVFQTAAGKKVAIAKAKEDGLNIIQYNNMEHIHLDDRNDMTHYQTTPEPSPEPQKSAVQASGSILKEIGIGIATYFIIKMLENRKKEPAYDGGWNG